MTIYQLVVKGESAGGNAFRNVHHYEFAAYDPDDTEKQEFVDNWDSDFKTNLQAFIHNSISLLSYELRRVDVGDLPASEWVPTLGAWTGTASGDKMPNQLCPMVTWKGKTTFPRTCRSYLWPSNEANNTAGGALSATLSAAVLSFAEAITVIDVTGQANPFKVSVRYGGIPRAVTDSNPVDAVIVSPRWQTQRRRVSGVGI